MTEQDYINLTLMLKGNLANPGAVFSTLRAIKDHFPDRLHVNAINVSSHINKIAQQEGEQAALAYAISGASVIKSNGKVTKADIEEFFPNTQASIKQELLKLVELVEKQPELEAPSDQPAEQKPVPQETSPAGAEKPKETAAGVPVGRNGSFLPPDGFQGLEIPDETITDTRTGTPEVSDPSVDGVGGEVEFYFVPLDTAGNPMDVNQYGVKFDLLPARHSYFDRQGQRVPDAGAGMSFNLIFNLAKLKIPGARPVYQQMGIDEEVIEMVGAFTGFDISVYEDSTGAASRNALEQAMSVMDVLNQGRELGLIMRSRADGKNVAIQTASGDMYTGFAKVFRRILAHEQRIYWRILFCVTNRDAEEDLNFGDASTAFDPEYNLVGGVGTVDNPEAVTAGGVSNLTPNYAIDDPRNRTVSVDKIKDVIARWQDNYKTIQTSAKKIKVIERELESRFTDYNEAEREAIILAKKKEIETLKQSISKAESKSAVLVEQTVSYIVLYKTESRILKTSIVAARETKKTSGFTTGIVGDIAFTMSLDSKVGANNVSFILPREMYESMTDEQRRRANVLYSGAPAPVDRNKRVDLRYMDGSNSRFTQ